MYLLLPSYASAESPGINFRFNTSRGWLVFFPNRVAKQKQPISYAGFPTRIMGCLGNLPCLNNRAEWLFFRYSLKASPPFMRGCKRLYQFDSAPKMHLDKINKAEGMSLLSVLDNYITFPQQPSVVWQIGQIHQKILIC